MMDIVKPIGYVKLDNTAGPAVGKCNIQNSEKLKTRNALYCTGVICVTGILISVISVLCLLLLLFTRYGTETHVSLDEGRVWSVSVESDKPWDYLMFTQRWPQTSCIDFKEHHHDATCNIYKNVTSWIVHGVWPNKIGGPLGPFYCNRSWEFEPERVTPIYSELLEHWPNIYGHSSVYSLWQHEWTKHGTCAAQIPQLNSELRYFKSGLELLSKYNVMALLDAAHVVASQDKGYDAEYIEALLEQHLLVKPLVVCDYDKETRRSYLSEVRICLSKMFHLIDCEKISASCPKGNATYYTPIQHNQ